MDKRTLLINIFLAIILYFGNGWIGKLKINCNGLFGYDSFGFNKVDSANFADHFFQKIVHPAILIAIAAAILQHLEMENVAKNLWLVVPIFWVMRLLHILIWNIVPFTNWQYEITSMIISLLLGEGTLFWIVCPLIDLDENIFIDAVEIRDAFWIAALSYVAKSIWDISKASLSGYSVFPSRKRAQTIAARYNAFKWKYDAEIKVVLRDHYSFIDEMEKQHFICLLYAIMIYEDHCRPQLIRCFEYIIKLFRRKSIMSLGIMQVQSKSIISNRTSIKLAIDKLYKAYSSVAKKDKIDEAISDYNHGHNYYIEVHTIYRILCNEFGLDFLDMYYND